MLTKVVARLGAAIGRGDTYQQRLTDSLAEIRTQKGLLETQGTKSEMWQSAEERKRSEKARKEEWKRSKRTQKQLAEMIHAKNQMLGILNGKVSLWY